MKLLLREPEKVDKILNEKGASSNFILFVGPWIEIYNKIAPNQKWVTSIPNWKKMQLEIAKKYNREYAKKMVDAAKLNYYKWTSHWKEFAKLRDQDIKDNPPHNADEGYGLFDPHGSWVLNTDAWFLFERCNDKEVLQRALAWAELSISLGDDASDVQVFDTKANLLYKLGRVDEAIAAEEKAIEIDKALAKKNGRDKGNFIDDYSEIIRKMKKGEPTWPVK